MKTIHLDPHRASYHVLRDVADQLAKGAVVIYPTDTIYGVGCDIFSERAIERIADIKKRDPGKPFSFICESVAQISEFAFIPNWAYRLMNRTLPGPYTYILVARKTNIPKKMLGKRNTVGVRIPDHPVCEKLVSLFGRPVLSSSVNLAGAEPLTDPALLPEEVTRKVDIVIDVGPLVSDPSTIIDATGAGPELVRHGKGPLPW
ncbi:MAG: threonylcarbamoyl-AMP synthase [Nitrospinae bacterium]|nr:threonylcarbamoyl-AMP synthase [Nitrospinota bacterium]